jgi:hypothetical protein
MRNLILGGESRVQGVTVVCSYAMFDLLFCKAVGAGRCKVPRDARH